MEKNYKVNKLVLFSQTWDFIYLKGSLYLKKLHEKSVSLLYFHTYGLISIIKSQADILPQKRKSPLI